jgi:hypothetical protein
VPRNLRGALLRTVLAIATTAGVLWAGEPVPAPSLTREHTHPSGAFTFRTPDGWAEQKVPTDPFALQVAGDGMVVRFLYQNREAGYDALHGHCMTQRLSEAVQTDPWIDFDYDFLSGGVGDYRFLDSAFRVRYDSEIQGHLEWRQRNLTLMGAGESLCVIVYVPSKVWKKSKASRALADAVVQSLTFK